MKKLRMYLIASICVGFLFPAWAGIRFVEPNQAIERKEIIDCMQIEIKGHAGKIQNRGGSTETIHLKAGKELTITARAQGFQPNTKVFVYTVDGGWINGTNITSLLQINPEGLLKFTFTAGQYFGNYPLVLRYNGKEQVINFWVDQAGIGMPEDKP